MSFAKVFEQFASFGGAPTKEMDNSHFTKMLKECKIIGKEFTGTDADMLFTKMKAKGARKITVEDFKTKGIPEIAKKLKKSNEDIEKMISSSAPSTANATKADNVKFHDDKSQYTGVYKAGGPTNVDRNAGSSPVSWTAAWTPPTTVAPPPSSVRPGTAPAALTGSRRHRLLAIALWCPPLPLPPQGTRTGTGRALAGGIGGTPDSCRAMVSQMFFIPLWIPFPRFLWVVGFHDIVMGPRVAFLLGLAEGGREGSAASFPLFTALCAVTHPLSPLRRSPLFLCVVWFSLIFSSICDLLCFLVSFLQPLCPHRRFIPS
eukprot:gene2368-1495_t